MWQTSHILGIFSRTQRQPSSVMICSQTSYVLGVGDFVRVRRRVEGGEVDWRGVGGSVGGRGVGGRVGGRVGGLVGGLVGGRVGGGEGVGVYK